MGGQLSCVRSSKDETTSKEHRPNQYDEIDDHFAIIPQHPNASNANSDDVTRDQQNNNAIKRTAARPASAHSSAQTTTPHTPVSAASYENVFLSSRDGTPVLSIGNDNKQNNNPTSRNGKVHEIQVSKDKSSASHVESSGVKTVEVTGNEGSASYENVVLKPKQSPKNEIHHQDNTVHQDNPSSGSRSHPPKPQMLPRIKDAPKTSPQIHSNSDKSKKGQQLNYVEVEFAPKSATASSSSSAMKTSSSSNSPKEDVPETTYTSVRHEDGRIILLT